MICRSCNRASLLLSFTLKNSPTNIQRLLTEEQLRHDKSVNLNVYQCKFCGMVQLSESMEETYYEDYIMATSHSPQMQAYQAEQAIHLVSSYGLQAKRVVEIGCGDGSFMEHMENAGAKVYGIEPSESFRTIAAKRFPHVQRGYVSANTKLEGGPFDAFVTRQVLEHVMDINGFLIGIRRNLTPEAIGLIEVPSLEKAISDARFYDFFPDHVNYFSLRTLRTCVEGCGFEVVEQGHGMNGEYNCAIVKVAHGEDPSFLGQAAVDQVQSMRKIIDQCHSKGGRIAFWGAGGKGLALMGVGDIRNIDLLVDADCSKQGKRCPITHVQVHPPEDLMTNNITLVVITAMAYHKEIASTLRRRLAYEGEIVLLSDVAKYNGGIA